MSLANLEKSDDGFSLGGEIRFNNVIAVRKKGNRFIDCSGASIRIDLSKVTSSDASVLSLLLRWLAYANQNNKRISYVGIPESLLNVAKVCGVVELVNGNDNG